MQVLLQTQRDRGKSFKNWHVRADGLLEKRCAVTKKEPIVTSVELSSLAPIKQSTRSPKRMMIPGIGTASNKKRNIGEIPT